MSIQIQSSAFTNGSQIPKQYTCDGQNASPPLAWSDVPQAAKSLALTVTDPDAPSGTWVHWVSYEIPPDTTQIAEGSQVGTQGKNDFGKLGYGGPCPPKGPAHRYFFRIFALDTHLDLQPGATEKQLMAAVQGHVLAQGELMGKYSR